MIEGVESLISALKQNGMTYSQIAAHLKAEEDITMSIDQIRYAYNRKDKNLIVAQKDRHFITEKEVLESEDYDPNTWRVTNLRRNGLSVKPKLEDKITFEDIERYFSENRPNVNYDPAQAINYDPSGDTLEVTLPDLHDGLLAWRKETGDDYDVHIAEQRLYGCMLDIMQRCLGRPIKKILFVELGDLLHFDNDKQETTRGTMQQADGRLAKIFDSTLDMIINCIKMLGDIAPVEVICLSGNHDEVSGRMLMKAAEMRFWEDDNVEFDIEPNPQKYREIGNSLIGWTHGNMPKKNMPNWLQQVARKEFGRTKHAEIHCGHFHSQHVGEIKQTEEDAGIIVRYLPTLCSSSAWEHQQGYPQTEKTLLSFLWNETRGLREIWYSNI